MILNRLSINTTDPRVFDLLNEMRKNRILYSICKTGSEPVDVLHRTDTITVYCTDETNIRQVVYNLNRAVGRGDITVRDGTSRFTEQIAPGCSLQFEPGKYTEKKYPFSLIDKDGDPMSYGMYVSECLVRGILPTPFPSELGVKNPFIKHY